MKASILVVDDQETIVMSTKAKLVSQGFDVDTACNGEEALDRVQEKSYDIVLLDINMPLMNGVQVLEFITAKHPYSDVMMMTGFDDFSLATECLKKGAKDYLLKPMDLTELVSRINALLRARASEHQYTDLRNFWQSTVLFDVFGSLQSVHFILNHAVESLKSALPEKDVMLLSHARALNERIAQTLKESVKVGDLAEGSLLFRQVEVDLGYLIKQICDRYEPCILQKGIIFQQFNDPKLPRVKCDSERIEQVVNAIIENGIGTSNPGDLFSVAVSKSQTGLYGEPSEYAVCKIEYSNHAITPDEILTILSEKEVVWNNISQPLGVGTFNLAISRRIIEAQGGAFQVESGEKGRIQVRFALPLM
jgi:DNA-binding response OmpR family regulator